MERMMNKRLLPLVILAVGLFAPALAAAVPVAAADSPSQIRAIHASPDTPAVDVYLDAATVVPALAFGNASGYLPVTTGTHDIRVFAAGADPTVDRPFIAAPGTQIPADARLSIVAAGMFASIRAVTVNDASPPPAAGGAKLRLVNVGADTLRVDLAAAGTVLFPNTSFGTITPYREVAAQSATLDVRPAGETKPLISTTVRPEAGSNSSVYLMSLGVVKTFVDTTAAMATASDTNAANTTNTTTTAKPVPTSAPAPLAAATSPTMSVMMGRTGQPAAPRDTLTAALVLISLAAIGGGFIVRRWARIA